MNEEETAVAEILEAGRAAGPAGGGADEDLAATTKGLAEDLADDELTDDADEADEDDEAADEDDDVAAEDEAADVVDEDDADEEDDEEDEGAAGGMTAGGSEDLLVREGDLAGDYLERLLDLLDYDGDIDLDVEAGRAVVSIDGGDDLQKLVGPNGSVLEALQELTRLAVQQETGVRSRLMLDIAQWRAGRRTELAEIGRNAAKKVLSTGSSVKLAPMTPFERKIVHDAVAGVDGVHSESEGEEPRRRVVVFRSD
jgi:spoIIIJ-associated protein